MLRRDERDPRRRERLAGSTLASLLLHVLIAALLFSVVLNTAQEGASESVTGAMMVTIEQRAPAVATVPVPAQQAAPVPHAARIAPRVQHAPLVHPARQPSPPQHHELSKFEPTAPPNPSPLPQASREPNPQPTTPVYEPRPANELPAVPTSVPSVSIQSIALKIPPTAAPSPAPSARPSAAPSPRPPVPTAAPSAKPATPAPVKPSAAPTAVAVAAKPTTAPTASPQPVPRASQVPAPKAGIPSPSPTQGPRLAKVTAGTAPSPGPKGQSSPGPRAGSHGAPKAGPQRPVAVRPTPSPEPPAAASHAGGGRDINAKLRALLPHNAVNPSQYEQIEHPSLAGHLDPTPPPDVLAHTKYLYEELGTGSDARIKMWVTSTRRVGPTLYCDGWMLRYPQSGQPAFATGTFTHPVAGGITISSATAATGTLPPIIEEHASTPCSQRRLAPFAPSPAASP